MPSAALIRRLAGALMLALGAALGAALPAVAQDSVATRTAAVTYRVGNTVYVSAGRDDGLVESQALGVVRGDSVVATLRVSYLASRQSSAEIVSGAPDIAVGDVVRYTPTRPTPAQAEVAARAPRPAARRLSGPGLHGRVGARYFVSRDEATQAGFNQPTADVRLEGQALGGSPLGLVADLRSRRTTATRADGGRSVDGQTLVYQAALHWNAPGAGFHGVLGRQYLTAVTSVSLFDGALVEMNTPHFSSGGFAGYEPEPVNLGFSSDFRDAGGYLQLHSRPGRPERWALSTGAVASYARQATNREFAFVQLSIYSRPFSLHAMQELDHYGADKVALGEPAWSWTSSYLSASVRPSRWLDLHGTFDNRRSVRLYRDVINPATAFDDAYRQGVSGGVSILGRGFTLGGELRRADGGAAGGATAWSVMGGANRLTALDLSVTARGTWYHNPSVDGQLYTVQVGGEPWPAVHLELHGGLRQENDPLATPTRRRFIWYGLDGDVLLFRSWFLSLSVERETGPDGRLTQVYEGLSWRF